MEYENNPEIVEDHNIKILWDKDTVEKAIIDISDSITKKLNHNKKGEIHEKYRDRKLANVGGQEPNGLTRNKMSGNYYPDGRSANHPKGKNPGDVFYDKSKPYAVIEREGIIYYRNLPPHNEIREYLIDARKKICMTIDELEDIFDNYTPHHWFEVNGSYPSTEDWKKS